MGFFLIVRDALQFVLELLDLFFSATDFVLAGFPGFLHLRHFVRGDEGDKVALALFQFDAGPRITRAAEDAVEGVVVFGGDGVEFVIVAAGAIQGEAQEGATEAVDGVFNC